MTVTTLTSPHSTDTQNRNQSAIVLSFSRRPIVVKRLAFFMSNNSIRLTDLHDPDHNLNEIKTGYDQTLIRMIIGG